MQGWLSRSVNLRPVRQADKTASSDKSLVPEDMPENMPENTSETVQRAVSEDLSAFVSLLEADERATVTDWVGRAKARLSLADEIQMIVIDILARERNTP